MPNPPPSNHGIGRKILFFLKFLEIRLRFVLILLVTALVVGYWDNIQNYYERWERNRQAQTSHGHGGGPHSEADAEFEYYCAMHPFVVRNHPGKCPICGMDLVKRKKGAPLTLPEGTLARVQVSPERIMQAGVEVEPVAYRLLTRTVRTYGAVEPDETRMAKIVARFPGRIDDLMVNAVGMVVKKGEPLARIYSPKFLAATQEYQQALKAQRNADADRQANADDRRRATQLAAYARQRLLMAGFTDDQLSHIEDNSESKDTVTLHAPLAGTVLEKNVLLGESMEEGSVLYTIADLSQVWVQALALESDLAAVKLGMPVEVTTVSYPGEIFYGVVNFIYPTLSADNRSVKVRVVVDNTAGKLKPGMYVSAVMRAPVGRYGDAGSFKDDAADKTTTAPSPAPPPANEAAMADMPGMANHGAMKNESASAKKAAVKLPTTTQEDANHYLATLAAGSEYYSCPMHSEVVSDRAGDCPLCGMHLEKKKKEGAGDHAQHPENAQPPAAAQQGDQPSQERWVEGYSCPMHPDELSPTPGICKICGCGMKLKKMRIERVLSIPEYAVIDTGARQIVYVESSPGVYDARSVTLGARAGAYYPVLDGIKLGDRIVARGSFLIDAEARLNPATAGIGASPSGGHQHGG